jgi:protein tyrosine phosphatase (PTP) superfamily phosphohydrolase (DUF442 family)
MSSMSQILFDQLALIEAFLPISPQLATSGQPTIAQFAVIAASGYNTVLNLAMPSSSNWLAEEKDVLDRLQVNYIHIPVLWENPTLADFDQIRDVIEAHKTQLLWIHCAKNMRVSAMLYLYHRLTKDMNHEVAWRYLEQIWQPDSIWRGFIEATLELYDK